MSYAYSIFVSISYDIRSTGINYKEIGDKSSITISSLIS